MTSFPYPMFDPTQYIREHIQKIEPYQPILPFEVLSQQVGLTPEEIVKLDANENPYGPLPAVADALARLPYTHIYPDPESRELCAALMAYTGVSADNLLVGAGADELIDLIMRLFLEPGDVIINCPPTFGMYAFDGQVNGAQVVSVPRRGDFSLDIDAIQAAVERYKPKLMFLASPNNPDGSLVPREEIEQLLSMPLLLVLDEAYIEFAGEAISLIRQVPHRLNLIVLRTFSKWAGLAGLRVGYGAFPDSLMDELWKIKQPYNVSHAASTAALVSLELREDLLSIRDAIVRERDRLWAGLQAIPYLSPYPSQANFILCRVNDRSAARLKAELAGRGIFVRYFNTAGLQDHIRVSVGKPGHLDRLLDALAEME